MRRTDLIFYALILAMVCSWTTGALAEPQTLAPSRHWRPIYPDVFGYNSNIGCVAIGGRLNPVPWDDPRVVETITKLHAGHIRFPGGSVSQIYNWKTDTLQYPIPPKGPDTLASHDIARMVERPVTCNMDGFIAMTRQLGITPLFVLNVAQENRPDQAAWADHLKAQYGELSVVHWELGNENAHWQDTKDIDVYLERVHPVGRHLLENYPGVNVAAVASPPHHLWQPAPKFQGEPKGVEQWNQKLAENDDFYNAIIHHAYLRSWERDQDRTYFKFEEKADQIEYLFAFGDEMPDLMLDYHHYYNGDKPLWLTEVGVLNDGVDHNLWGVCLAGMSYELNLLVLGDQVRYISRHLLMHVPANDMVAIWITGEQGELDSVAVSHPVGKIHALNGEAARNADRIAPLDIAPGATFPGHLSLRGREYPALSGLAIDHPRGRYLFIVNRHNDATEVTVPKGPWQVEQYHGRMLGPLAEVEHTQPELADGQALPLPPLSFTRLFQPNPPRQDNQP